MIGNRVTFVQITTGADGDGGHVLYGLDRHGRVWRQSMSDRTWGQWYMLDDTIVERVAPTSKQS